MTIEVLVAEYPGDRAWLRFAATFAPSHGSQGTLPGVEPTLAKVLLAELGAQAASWVAQPLRALEGRSPAEVLAEHPQGLMAVRSVVMRMPR
jgi:hypothetical protein